MSNRKILASLILAAFGFSGGAQAMPHTDSLVGPISGGPTQGLATSDEVDPFAYFHVYSLSDIGKSTNPYGSDFQGVTGAANDVFVKNFTFFNLENNDYALHTGGDAIIRNGSHNGHLDAGGDALIKNATWGGDVHVGGNLLDGSGWGTITGHTYVKGTAPAHLNGYGYWGGLDTGVTYEAMFDFDYLNDLFTDVSLGLGDKADTGTVASNGYGKLTLNAVSGENVFTLTAAELNSAHTVEVVGPADAVVYVNVEVGGTDADKEAVLNSTTWRYLNGAEEGNVIVNYEDATRLDLSGGNSVNLLAPFADVYFSSGLVTGNMIAGALFGGGQINLGHFTGGYTSTAVPEPSTILMFALGLLGLAGLRARKA